VNRRRKLCEVAPFSLLFSVHTQRKLLKKVISSASSFLFLPFQLVVCATVYLPPTLLSQHPPTQSIVPRHIAACLVKARVGELLLVLVSTVALTLPDAVVALGVAPLGVLLHGDERCLGVEGIGVPADGIGAVLHELLRVGVPVGNLNHNGGLLELMLRDGGRKRPLEGPLELGDRDGQLLDTATDKAIKKAAMR
jgi:hypothetical protein